MICEACGPDFQTAMIHTTACGLAPDESWTTKIGPENQAKGMSLFQSASFDCGILTAGTAA